MTTPVTVDLNRGSDLSLAVTWPDAAGDPLDLTGYTAEIIFAAAALTAAGIAVAITDAEAGVTTVTMDWDDALADLDTLPSFAVRIVPPSGARQASPRILLRYL